MPQGTPNERDIEHALERALRKVFSEEVAEFRKRIAEELDNFGVDITTATGRQDVRDDITWVRDARKGTAVIRKTAGIAMITTFVSGAAFGLWTMLVWIASLGGLKGHGP